MRLILAPDSFKGSLSAVEAAVAMAAGARRASVDIDVVLIPLADGGEGTVDALVRALDGTVLAVSTVDPLGRPVRAHIGLLGHGGAVIELAAASGLPLLRAAERDPFRAGTAGTGRLIRAALDQGAREIILGVGGSATVDGGAGALQALGARMLDAEGRPIPDGNAGLAHLASIDLSAIDPRLSEMRLRVACDVTNPLTGPRGAAAVFGPQKGARPEDIPALDRNLAHFAAIARRDLDIDVDSVPGAGAAGGLTAGLLLLGAVTEPGIDLVLEVTRFAEQLRGADLVLSGEGKIDGQTAHGKVISGVLARTLTAGVPLVALAGTVQRDELDSLYEAGLAAAFPIVDGPMSLDTAVAQAAPLLERATEAALRLWLARPAGARRARSADRA
jgi:glycerate kinase